LQAFEVHKVNTYEEIVTTLKNQKEETITLNSKTRNYFKFSPGSQASEWERFKEEEIAAISYENQNFGDISDIDTQEKLNRRAGFRPDDLSNVTWNLLLFRNANKGDIIFVNKGTNTCIGIGVIEGDYYYDENDHFKHKRKVKWITDKVYQYKTRTYSNYATLFRPDTFSPTLVWEFILNEYVRLYPELKDEFDKYNIEFDLKTSNAESYEQSEMESEVSEENTVEFWWLNANPKMWAINTIQE